jgi:hypothetical protein
MSAAQPARSAVLEGNSRTITSRASVGPKPDGSATRPGKAQPASKFASTTAENAAYAGLGMIRSARLGRILVQAAAMGAQCFACYAGGANIILEPELDYDLKRQANVAILGKRFQDVRTERRLRGANSICVDDRWPSAVAAEW